MSSSTRLRIAIAATAVVALGALTAAGLAIRGGGGSDTTGASPTVRLDGTGEARSRPARDDGHGGEGTAGRPQRSRGEKQEQVVIGESDRAVVVEPDDGGSETPSRAEKETESDGE